MVKIYENNHTDDYYNQFIQKYDELKLEIWKNRIENDFVGFDEEK